MSDVVELSDIQLIPVLELAPMTFSTVDHPSPENGPAKKHFEEWDEYWRNSLAEAGITGLHPITPGSWHVATDQFTKTQLEAFLQVIFEEWGGVDVLNDPDSRPLLDGGLAMSTAELGIRIEPTCCSDLGNIANWKEAATFDGEVWKMLWIGHPWLYMKYEKPHLVLSEPSESDDPAAKWKIMPDILHEALIAAEAELLRFSKLIEPILAGLDTEIDAARISRELVGLEETSF